MQSLGKNASAVLDYLEATYGDRGSEGIYIPRLDTILPEWGYESGGDSERETEDDDEEFKRELLEIRARTGSSHDLGEVCYLSEKDLHQRILQSIEEDERLTFLRELDSESSMGELELACAALLSLVMEPGRESESADISGVGRKRYKAPRPRQPYTITCALKKSNWFEKSFDWDNAQFRLFYRMSKPTFWGIVRILEQNPLFTTIGPGRRQRPVPYQLGVFLLRYGTLGTAARFPMMLSSIGEGTVLLYCRRIIRAIREFGLSCVGWPTPERKEVIKAAFGEQCGLDGVIGALDGSLFELANKPRINGDSYISRDGTPSTKITVMAIADHEGRFIAFQSGSPGSKNDTWVWNNSDVCENRHKLFAPGEFLLADGGYPISPYVLIPYTKSERRTDGPRKKKFGRMHASARVIIECAFGRLKARFPCLHRLGAVEDMRELYRAVEALMILHNMCYDLHDNVDGFADDFMQARIDNNEEVYDYVAQEDGLADMDIGELPHEGEDLRAQGLVFRDQCLDIVCPK